MNSSSSPEMAYKSLQIYQNLIGFFNNREMIVETDAKGMFSAEDSTNCAIPCALSAITFEIYDSFKSILKFKAKP